MILYGIAVILVKDLIEHVFLIVVRHHEWYFTRGSSVQCKGFETENISSNSIDFKVSVYLLFLNKSCVSRVFFTEGVSVFGYLSVLIIRNSRVLNLENTFTGFGGEI